MKKNISKSVFGICFAAGLSLLSVEAKSFQFIQAPVLGPSLPVIQIESAGRARAIIRQIEKGADRCSDVDADQVTACIARALRKAGQVGSSRGFGEGKTPAALLRAARKMDALPDNGSDASLRRARSIILSLNGEIKSIAAGRPAKFRKYQIQVAESVLSLLGPLEKKRT